MEKRSEALSNYCGQYRGNSASKNPPANEADATIKKGIPDTKNTKSKVTIKMPGDDPRSVIQTTAPNQSQIGINHQMFCGAVTLPIQSLWRYAATFMSCLGLTRTRSATTGESAHSG